MHPGEGYPATGTRVSRNSYQAAGNRVSQRIESAATCIQLPELESAVAWSQFLSILNKLLNK